MEECFSPDLNWYRYTVACELATFAVLASDIVDVEEKVHDFCKTDLDFLNLNTDALDNVATLLDERETECYNRIRGLATGRHRFVVLEAFKEDYSEAVAIATQAGKDKIASKPSKTPYQPAFDFNDN